jgi:hypothetical protein
MNVKVRETFRNVHGKLFRELEICMDQKIEAVIPIMKIQKNKTGGFVLNLLVDHKGVMNSPVYKKKREAVEAARKWSKSRILKKMVLNHIDENFHQIYFSSQMNENVQCGLRKIAEGILEELSGNEDQIRRVL